LKSATTRSAVLCAIDARELRVVVWGKGKGPHLASNVALHHLHTLDGLHGHEVHRNHNSIVALRHALEQHLAPATGRRAQVDCARGVGQKPKLFVQMQQLEGRSRAVAALLGKSVENVLSRAK
jgi:hypothetical protein